MKKKNGIFVFNISCFLRVSCCFQLKKDIWCKKKIPGGGGGGVEYIFRKTVLSHFTFYAIFNITKHIETPCLSVRPSRLVYWLNGRWFLQIVDRDSWNLYPLYPLFPCSDFVSQMWGWFGGGGGGV